MLTAEEIPSVHKLLLTYRAHPDRYIEDALGAQLHAYQRRIIQSVWANRWTLVQSANGLGKTWTSARVVLTFLQLFPDSIVYSTAPTWQQVEDLLWKEIHNAWDHAHPKLVHGTIYTRPRLQIGSSWFAKGLSPKKPGNFQGVHGPYLLYVFDEAPEIPDPIYEALMGNMSGGSVTRFLGVGNPTTTATSFYRLCLAHPECVIKLSAFDSPNYTHFGITLDDILAGTWRAKVTGPWPFPELTQPDFAEEVLRTYGLDSIAWKARVLGEFPEQGTDALIWRSWVLEANRIQVETVWTEPVQKIHIAIDMAAGGGCETVISAFAIRPTEPAQHILQRPSSLTDTMATVDALHDAICDLARDYPAIPISLRIDADGLGQPIYDLVVRLKAQNPADWPSVTHIFDFHGGITSPEPDAYPRARTYHWFGFREKIQRGKVGLMPDVVLEGQLCNIRYREKNQKTQVEPKEEAARRGIPSPDRADAAMMAMATVTGVGVFGAIDLTTGAKPTSTTGFGFGAF